MNGVPESRWSDVPSIAIHHWVMGRPAGGDLSRTSPLPERLRPFCATDVPIASAEQADRFVTEVSAARRGWIDTPFERRRELLLVVARRFAQDDPGMAALWAAQLALPADSALAVIHVAHQRFLETVEHARPADHAIDPGVCVVSTEYPLRDASLLVLTGQVLLAGGVVIHRPALDQPMVALLAAVRATLAGLPDGLWNVVHGDDETLDALVTSPAVDQVVASGPAHELERLRMLGSSFRAPVLGLEEFTRTFSGRSAADD